MAKPHAEPAPAVMPPIQQALAAHQQGRLAEAERIYDAILRQDPHHVVALQYCGLLKHQQGHSVEALRLVGAALKARPNSLDALWNYGLMLEEMRRPEEAVAAYDRILAIDARHAAAHTRRAVAHARLGRHDEALRGYKA